MNRKKKTPKLIKSHYQFKRIIPNEAFEEEMLNI